MKRAPLVALVLCALAARLQAGGLRDLEDAWLLPASAAWRLVAPAAPPAPGWSCSVSQGRLFGLEELPQIGIAVGRRGPKAAARLRWERLGRSLYREDQLRAELLVGRAWRLGAEVGFARLALAGDRVRQATVLDLRLRASPGARLRLDLWWPVTDAPAWHGRHGLRRWLRLAGHGDGWAWCAVADRRGSGDPVLQGEVMLQLAASAALGLRVEPWSGAAGFCTAWRLGGLLLRSSHLAHPDLGPTHRWSLGIGAGH